MKNIILASQSPRRKELLALLDLKFTIEIKAVDEVYPDNLNYTQVAEYLAKLKASAFKNIENDQLIITADTVVVLEGRILGKPKDKTEAIRMLESLSPNLDAYVMHVKSSVDQALDMTQNHLEQYLLPWKGEATRDIHTLLSGSTTKANEAVSQALHWVSELSSMYRQSI